MFYKNERLICIVTMLLSIIIIGFLYNEIINQSKVISYYQKNYFIYKTKYENSSEKYNKLKREYEKFVRKYFFVEVTVTAYTTAKNETNDDPGNTSLMNSPVSGWTCAVSRDLKYLLGKVIYIEGVGVRLVNDLMNKRYTRMIDVLVSNKKVARTFGKKKNIKIVLIPDYNQKKQ